MYKLAYIDSSLSKEKSTSSLQSQGQYLQQVSLLKHVCRFKLIPTFVYIVKMTINSACAPTRWDSMDETKKELVRPLEGKAGGFEKSKVAVSQTTGGESASGYTDEVGPGNVHK